MAWSAETSVTQANVGNTETTLDDITLSPGEIASVVVIANPDGTTDDGIVRVFRSTDGGTTFATEPELSFTLENAGSGTDVSKGFTLAGAQTLRIVGLSSGSTDTVDFTVDWQTDGVSL